MKYADGMAPRRYLYERRLLSTIAFENRVTPWKFRSITVQDIRARRRGSYKKIRISTVFSLFFSVFFLVVFVRRVMISVRDIYALDTDHRQRTAYYYVYNVLTTTAPPTTRKTRSTHTFRRVSWPNPTTCTLRGTRVYRVRGNRYNFVNYLITLFYVIFL